MIKEAIGTGATVEEAIENAKKALGAPESADVSTEVLELPKKKTLGLFGGSPAKARAYYDAPEEKKAEPNTDSFTALAVTRGAANSPINILFV